MKTKMLNGMLVLAGLVGVALPAAAQDVTAEVRTWTGESWRLTQPSLEIFYTIMPEAGEAGEPVSEGMRFSLQEFAARGERERTRARQLEEAPPLQGHRQTEVVTLSRKGVETQIPLASIRSLQFFRQPVEKSLLPSYVASAHFRTSATAVLVDGSRVEGDYVNLGTMVLRGMTPEGRVDIPWQEIENVRFEPAEVAKTTEERVAPPPTVAEAPKPPRGISEITPLQDVFFDFDRFALRNDTKAALNQNVKWLKANLDAKVVVEGYCDERGTNEYNLALGERRANAVRDYLMGSGIDQGRVSTISYGEERPFVLSHDESSWQWNRRAHFVVKK